MVDELKANYNCGDFNASFSEKGSKLKNRRHTTFSSQTQEIFQINDGHHIY